MTQAVTSYDRIGDGNSQNAHVSRQQLDAYIRRIDLRTNEQALFNVPPVPTSTKRFRPVSPVNPVPAATSDKRGAHLNRF